MSETIEQTARFVRQILHDGNPVTHLCTEKGSALWDFVGNRPRYLTASDVRRLCDAILAPHGMVCTDCNTPITEESAMSRSVPDNEGVCELVCLSCFTKGAEP